MIEKIVVARNNKYGIGYKGDIPWFIKEDLLHFKEQTINQIVVMGKDTYLGMCSKFNKEVGSVVLSNRFNIVISKTLKEEGLTNKPGIAFFNSIPEFRKYIKTEVIKAKLYKSGISEIIYMGGESIYSEALQYATELVLTEVETNRLCELIPTTIRNEDTSGKVKQFNIETRAEVVNDLYSELNIRRLRGQRN